MRATTRADRTAPHVLAYKVLAGVVAAGIFVLGIPQLGASLLMLYAGSSPTRDVAALQARAALLDRADTWFGDAAARLRAGMVELDAARAAGGKSGPDPALMAKALADLSAGLDRRPGDVLGWSALAEARLAAGDRPGAAAALRVSILLGPYEPELVMSRSALGLALWRDLDTDQRLVVGGQMRLAWDLEPQELLALARRDGNALPALAALAQDPTRLAAFMKASAARR